MAFGKACGFPSSIMRKRPEVTVFLSREFRLYSGEEILIFPHGDASSAWEKRFDLLSPIVLTVG
jgi:hypothetical protein